MWGCGKMNEVAQFISQVGFPSFVAVWMLYKTSKDSEALKDSVNELKDAIDILTNEFKHHDENEGSKVNE